MVEIDVFASLPWDVAVGADLDLSADNWHWTHCLTLPLEKLNALQLTHRPYKWIRYAIGVFIGANGFLSTSPDPESPHVVDYDALPRAESADLYYHTSDEERRRMFPFDPNMTRTAITPSAPTTRRGRFREDVARRDGGVCVLTRMEATDCDVVHLLAHGKDDAYISTYTRHRNRSATEDDVVQEMDSIRNGIFINKIAHARLGKDIAFLMTPNFAMDTSDVDPSAPAAENRCTSHVFMTPLAPVYVSTLQPGSPLAVSDTSEWPPAILFDAVYASAVFHHFGTRAAKDAVIASWQNTFYPGGVMSAAQAEHTSILDERAAIAKMTEEQARTRAMRYNDRARRMGHDDYRPDLMDMVLMVPYMLVPRDKLQAMFKRNEEKAEAAKQKCVREKVNAWMKQVDM